MKIAYITAGAAGMYCGTCLHDNTLAATLMERGHEVSLTPTYTPPRTDEVSVVGEHIFFGAINVYLQQKVALFRHTPRFFDSLLDNKRLLGMVSKFASGANDPRMLGEMTLSMLQAEEGRQAKELEKMVEWLEDILQPDIVHLSFSLFAGFARQIKERLGVPVVCSLQGEDLFLSELEEPYLSRVLQTLRERDRDVDAFVAPCRYYAELMSAEHGLPRERVYVARLGIHTEGFRDMERSGKADSEAPVVLGCLARVCPEKGTAQLVEAFRLLCEQPGTERLRLRIAGFLRDRDREFLEEQQRKLAGAGLAGRVDWVGEVDLRGKLDFFSSLDIFSMPTVYREPKGLPVLEAMASGLPVVQPAHGAFPEWIEHTGGGVLVEPLSPQALADGIRELLDDPDKRLRLGRRGRAAVLESFDHDAAADDMLAVYERVLAGRDAKVDEPETRRSAVG
ncbi:MAG: glycosyltransferase family 4 protein [bacterium]|nr:glycosyltransferase family 4 protein [bacterium]